ncbi:MAG: ABC transporter substrate-binding protein [Deltaproteobacteria bacterium]|nr:ABC transporter substrate-binding protein [Deltaproteobacteria bacterium]
MRAWPLIGLILLVGCDRDRSHRPGERGLGPGKARDPGTVVVGRPSDALGLDPARVTDNESVELAEQLYDKLLDYDPETRTIVPALATKWQVSEDGRIWTFQLRRGVRFHDGTPLTADAVVFSLERQRDVRHPFHLVDGEDWKFQYWESTYQNIEKVEATGPHTVRVTIERRYAPLAANLAMFPVSIVSPAAVERWGVDYGRRPPEEDTGEGLQQRGAPVGTGPFRFVGWDGPRIILERNPDYWGKKASIKRLVFVAIPDARQRLVALESGAIDIAYSILPQEMQFVQLHPELVLHRTAANTVAYLAMNTSKKPFTDIRVRRAINHAINKEPIVKLAFQGLAEPASGPLPPSQWGHYKPRVRYPYDPDRARELIAEALADPSAELGELGKLRLFVPSTPRPYLPDPRSVADILAANLRALGLTIEVVEQPFDRHLHDLRRGEHDLCLHGWVGDNGDPDNYLYVLFDRNNATVGFARNVAFFTDPELHGLLVLAQESDNRQERERIYERAQELIASQAPWVPLAHSQVAIAARRDIEGVTIGPATHVPYERVRRVSR